MNYRFKDDNQLRRGKNWMSAMGVLFIVMAVVIALRNLYFVSTQLSFEFYLDNYTNGDITNEKFVIAMLIGGGFLLYWGRFRKKDDDNEVDDYDHRRRPPSPGWIDNVKDNFPLWRFIDHHNNKNDDYNNDKNTYFL